MDCEVTNSDNPELGKSVLAAGRATNYLEAGDGFPVLLLHGSGPGVTAYANWRLTLPALAPHFRVLAPDCAGFGYTERKPGERYDLDGWVEHIVGFLDALGVAAAHVVGNSFGGALALALADRHPERVERLLLMGAAATAFPITEGLDAVWGYQPSPAAMEAIMGWFAYDRGLIGPELIRLRYEASLRPGYQESYAAMFPAPRQRHVDALALPEERLRGVRHRTLIVHGRDDRVIPLSSSLRLHHLLDASDLHVFGQCGHWTQIEKRDRFNRLAVDFFTAG